MPAPFTQSTWEESSQSCDDARRAARSTPSGVDVAGDRLLRAIDVAAGSQRRAGAQQRLRRHARPVRALAADQLGLDESGAQAALASRSRRRSRRPRRLR